MGSFSRRDVIKGSGLVGVTAAVAAAHAQPPERNDDAVNARDVLAFFTSEEAEFVTSAVARLIPPDEQWGGAEEAGVLYYIDGQLAGAYGAGARMYLDGPWDPDAPPQQGYQLKYSPAELYRVAIREIRDHVREVHGGREFTELADAEQDELLTDLERGRVELPSLPAPVFFETLLANTVEGFFSDPAYRGNRNMLAWRMIGFPGAYAQYLSLVDQHGYELRREPLGIAGTQAALAQAKNRGA